MLVIDVIRIAFFLPEIQKNNSNGQFNELRLQKTIEITSK